MATTPDLKNLTFVAADPSYYEDAWYEVDDQRRGFTVEEAERIEAGFDRICAAQFAAAEEIAGWIIPGFDPDGAFGAVELDRSRHVAVYVRKDGSRETKPIPAFIDDPLVPPPDTRPQPAAKAAGPRFKFIRKHLALLN